VNLPVIWSDEARTEFYDAALWYAQIGEPLSERFIDAVGKTAQLIGEYPYDFRRFTEIEDGRRYSAFPMASSTRLRPTASC